MAKTLQQLCESCIDFRQEELTERACWLLWHLWPVLVCSRVWILFDWILFDWILFDWILFDWILFDWILFDWILFDWILFDWILFDWILFDWILFDWILFDWILFDWILFDWILFAWLQQLWINYRPLCFSQFALLYDSHCCFTILCVFDRFQFSAILHVLRYDFLQEFIIRIMNDR